jgi:hypothetical protein
MEAALTQSKQPDEPRAGCSRDAEAVSVFKWPHAAILLLVETYRGYEGDLVGGKVSQKKAWDKVADTMRHRGYDVTGPQCQSKFNGMKRTYKAIKDHNAKSGNGPRTWPYLEVMESLLGERPFIAPIALASSSSGAVKRSRTEGDTVGDEPAPTGPLSPKRRNAMGRDIASAILESRRIAEEGRNKRHNEKMARQDALLGKLDQLIKKL